MPDSAADVARSAAASPAELKAEFKLSYHIDCLERAARSVYGSSVLEIGGTLPRELVIEHYQVGAWTAVDNRSSYASMLAGEDVGARMRILDESSTPASDGGYASYDGDAAALPESFEGAFDVVISLATFEHVQHLPTALDHMRRALKPGGRILAQVGPVWSGWRGHHVFPGHLGPDSDKTEDLLQRMTPWQHLIMPPSDMHAWLTDRYGADFADRAVDWILRSPRLNRLFFEDYQRMFAAAGLQTLRLTPNGAPISRGWEVALRPALTAHHAWNRAFDIDSFWVALAAPPEHPAR